jgi:anti-sigma factor RsiW
MSRCDALRGELADAALGQPVSEPLRSHLGECDICAAELQRQRALVQRMDAAVGRLVRAEPPAKLLKAVRERTRRAGPLAGEARPRSWSRQRVGIAAGAAIAACLAIAVGVNVLRPHGTPVSSAIAVTAWRSPTAVLLEPRGSVLHAPLRDIWFDLGSGLSHSKPSPGETHGT